MSRVTVSYTHLEDTEAQLNEIIEITEERLSAKEADVFRAHLMMLADPMLEETVMDKINNCLLYTSNAAFPYGNGNNDANMGAKNTLKAIERILEMDGKYDIPLDKYGGINMDAIVPVSYTHLDVYKRQENGAYGENQGRSRLSAPYRRRHEINFLL